MLEVNGSTLTTGTRRGQKSNAETGTNNYL